MSKEVVVLIMAGGRGERFWPASRNNLPKQFLVIDNNPLNLTMIQETVYRLKMLVKTENIFILTNRYYEELIKAQLPQLKEENIIYEPCGKNTAPAINLGLEIVNQIYDDYVMIVLPSDHLIRNEENYLNDLRKAIAFANNRDVLLTIGITPTSPNTEYGYIHLGDKVSNDDIYKVSEFKEKPNEKTATKYLLSHEYVWNSGMFIWSNKALEKALKEFVPQQYNQMHEIFIKDKKEQEEALREVYEKIDNISIDYALMEKAQNVYTIKSSFVWDDVGSWKALERIYGCDNNKNTLVGNTYAYETTNTIAYSKGPLIVTNHIDNLIVVATNDIVLVSKKESINEIKKLISSLPSDKEDKL